MTRSLAALLAVAALAACASGPGRGGPPGAGGHGRPQGAAYRQSVFLSGASLLFVQFDADHDYVTTRAEAQAGAEAEWRRATAGAGVMTPIQFAAWSATALGGPNIGPYRLAFDRDVNNEITPAEFVAAIMTKFDQFDADKDGVLHRAEMTEHLPEQARGPGAGAPGGGEGQGPPRGRPERR
jgi:hypothetical protein